VNGTDQHFKIEKEFHFTFLGCYHYYNVGILQMEHEYDLQATFSLSKDARHVFYLQVRSMDTKYLMSGHGAACGACCGALAK